MPGLVLDQVAAQHRPARRRHRRRYGDDGAGLGPFGRGKHSEQHRHAHGGEQSAADPLGHAGGDQGVDVPGEGAGQRPQREHGEGEHERPLRAELVPRPAADGDEDGQAQQVGGNHPLYGRRVCFEISGEGGDGDVDDRRVQQAHEHAEGKDGSDDPLVFQSLHAHPFPERRGPALEGGGRAVPPTSCA